MKFTSKKIISVIALIALVITSLTVFASCGASVPGDDSGTVGGITWKYVKDGNKLEIIGNPAEPVEISNYSTDSRAPWYTYKDYVKQITITGVSRIGDYAFYNLHYVTKIDLGASLKEIGKFAFAFCGGSVDFTKTSPISLSIPEGVTAIGESAFECCSILSSVTLPHSIESVGDRAFAYSSNLTKASIPEAFKTANEESFGDIFKKDLDKDGNPVLPEIAAVAVPTTPEEKPAESESAEGESAEATEPATDATEAETEAETEKETEKETEAETEAAPQNKTTTIIAIVVLALIIIGIIVGAVLLMRSNKKITKDSRTVRKNDNSKKGKKK